MSGRLDQARAGNAAGSMTVCGGEPRPIGFGPDGQRADDAVRQQEPAQDDVALFVTRERAPGRTVTDDVFAVA